VASRDDLEYVAGGGGQPPAKRRLAGEAAGAPLGPWLTVLGQSRLNSDNGAYRRLRAYEYHQPVHTAVMTDRATRPDHRRLTEQSAGDIAKLIWGSASQTGHHNAVKVILQDGMTTG
jgi:hypothetical protein